MYRILTLLKIPIILFGLSVAIVAPIMMEGFIDQKNAQVAFDRKDFSDSGVDYESAARRLSWRSELWEQAGKSYVYGKDWEDAVRVFEIARRQGGLSAEGWEMYGEGYWVNGKDGEAMEIWTAGLKQYPSYTGFFSDFALVYRDLKNYKEEQNALEIWLAAGKGTAIEHYELGQLLMTSDPGRALQEFRYASALDPEFFSVVQTLNASLDLAATESEPVQRLVIIGRGLGLVYEWGLASQAFERAVNLDNGNAEAWAWLGEARQHQGQDGKEELDKALSIDPHDTVIHALRGLYWKRQGLYTNGLAEYQQAAEIEPENPTWRVSIGELSALNGDLVSALGDYQKATSLAPNDATYWRLLAMFCSDTGVQVQEVGLPAAQKAAEIAPNDPQVSDALGWSYLNAGYLYNAEQNLLKAIKAEPDLALAHIHLAELYLRKGDRASAFVELNNVRQLDANGPSGQLAAQLLKQYFP